ncbi:unnamed protein product [Cuscuta epithymum]|uniref:Spermidine hydroxycinnamoyl transferase n=1 Tax=Cuscuta epithymum TaxID=186058 RepID=A0AAV0CA24_9ASTE|nr:unnamed protein product [Cuscuta epithymum]
MKVCVKSSNIIVKPSEPTWNGILELSELDQTGTMMHVPTIYFYATSPQPPESLMETLKSSLSQVLVHFYPMAGRLNWATNNNTTTGRRLVLDCNSEGVILIEAESDGVLSELGDFYPQPDFDQLVPSAEYYTAPPIQKMPLFIGQLTKFRCGGWSLGLAISHVVSDGLGTSNFLHQWARLARGKPLSVVPFLDREVLHRVHKDPLVHMAVLEHYYYYNYYNFGGPPLIIGESSNKNEKKKETKVCVLRLSKPQIETLKKVGGANYTRYEVVTAHIWKCACKARNHKADQQTNLTMSVDIRKRMDPPLHNSYFGNAVIDVVTHGISGEVISMPLGQVARMIRETIDSVTPECVTSAISFLKGVSRGREEELPFSGNPNLSVTSWMSLPLHGLDFGWGEEIHMGPGNHTGDGDILILPSREGDGSLLVALSFQADHIEDFKKCFYQAAYMIT